MPYTLTVIWRDDNGDNHTETLEGVTDHELSGQAFTARRGGEVAFTCLDRRVRFFGKVEDGDAGGGT